MADDNGVRRAERAGMLLATRIFAGIALAGALGLGSYVVWGRGSEALARAETACVRAEAAQAEVRDMRATVATRSDLAEMRRDLIADFERLLNARERAGRGNGQ